MKRRREGKEREAPTRKIKISNFSHGSRVTKFRTMAQRAWRQPARYQTSQQFLRWIVDEKLVAVDKTGFAIVSY